MPGKSNKFPSIDGRRTILVAEDEAINREILGMILQNDYKVLFAEDGNQALMRIEEEEDNLSLILLDLLMPGIHGLDLLKRIKSDRRLQRIPVIVMTSEQTEEVKCLELGAIDFIPKPYPQPAVIQARVWRTIELSEDRDTIRFTERDTLSGLYNREYFYRYARQFDQHNQDVPMDAVVIDINHFHMINERYGKVYADDLLRRIGEALQAEGEENKGLACRLEADTFLLYCPHRTDYPDFLESLSLRLSDPEDGEAPGSRGRLRMGIYSEVDRSIDMERRFDRAKQAADTVKNTYAKTIGYYDMALHEKALYAEQLIEDFPRAVREKQFLVYYQPKFDIRMDIPVLASAEALVRWRHPALGMISPGIFIPLFEANGLIQELDKYVWREAAAQISRWKQKFHFTVPVSVNVSRIDMYDPNLLETLQEILRTNDLTPGELLLEITESAYTQNSQQIIEAVEKLREQGFRIEMDDFGTGYSSLNMISKLPVDALKLDMQFIRNAFSGHKDTRMLEVIIDIADYLGVPVIAEGVETEEQLNTLKAMGCDLVQGFYFSKPVPAESYEHFMEERQVQEANGIYEENARHDRHEPSFGKITHALSSGFESIYYVDTENDHYVEFSSEGRCEDLQIERSGRDFFHEFVNSLTRILCPEDQERVTLYLEKKTLLDQISDSHPFTMTYRVMLQGEPVYYNLKAVKANTHDDHHIVIGVSNVNQQVRQAGTLLEKKHDELNFSSLIQILSSDMESIYYVDTCTNIYTEFRTNHTTAKMPLEMRGMDFFAEYRQMVHKMVFLDDQEKVLAVLNKENLLSLVKDHQVFSLVYRMMIGGEPVYYRMKIVEGGNMGDHHLVIGVANIDHQISIDQKMEAERQNSVTYARIAQALSQDYFSIYYVDIETDYFIEYSSHGEYEALGIETKGYDFFNLSQKNVKRVVYSEDQEKVLSAFTKKNILKVMGQDRTFSLTYRLMLGGIPTYVNMKATWMQDGKKRYIVIGISNVDEQMRKEEEYTNALLLARELANRDALTGVKSKHAYVEAERQYNKEISDGKAEPFAVVVCDVNGLKHVNDTWGHKAGDQFLKDACRRICRVFAHSPVFRIGGDEFVAVVREGDFENREELMAQLAQKNQEAREPVPLTIACGYSDFRPAQDTCFIEVFDRADEAMYINKAAMKEKVTS